MAAGGRRWVGRVVVVVVVVVAGGVLVVCWWSGVKEFGFDMAVSTLCTKISISNDF